VPVQRLAWGTMAQYRVHAEQAGDMFGSDDRRRPPLQIRNSNVLLP
jgi:hypothetical protein